MPAPDVAALLAELETTDPDAVDDARDAVDWLTGGEGLETITQLSICEFLWYALPLKWAGSVEERISAAWALSRLLTLGGLERYAALCVSPTTTQILRTYDRDGDDAGVTAYQRAMETTGLLPPDMPELTWSAIMGPEEVGAHDACAAALELAIVSGELAPSSRTWRSRRNALINRWLTTPRNELGGDSWLQRIHGERLNRWALGRGQPRRRLAQPFEVRLHAAIPVPDAAGHSLEPLRWLLEHADTGVPLTQKHFIARALVVEAFNRFGWESRCLGTPRCENDLSPLQALRELAQHEMRALRRTGRALLITGTGRALLSDPDLLWQAASSALIAQRPDEQDFDVSVREISLMVLADGATLDRGELAVTVAEALAGEGWRTGQSGGVDVGEVRWGLNELERRLEIFRLVAPRDRWDSPIRLTAVGQTAALTALRTRALLPRQYVGMG
ncbi:hypothetical protein [Rhizohabitans arisaemae]|uniref:hypothetical protein n=1 Tax=Rhizohabitans arisaemae TaxID=2720610 RepID=UPI0024B28007|nr:hypothetical protein [Rhizohabitans arisaemae]